MNKIENISFGELIKIHSFDVFIAAVGQETRAPYLSKLLKHNKFIKKYCVKVIENPDVRIIDSFISLGFNILNNYDDLISNISGDHNLKKVLIDYSVMNKYIYANLINFFHNAIAIRKCELYFSYTLAKYEKPHK